MAYKLIISKEANKDIDEIIGYMALVLCNSTAAKSFLDDVEKSYNAVIDNPSMYSLCYDERLRKDGYRKIAVKNYIILYRSDDKEKSVIILRVIYGGRNYIDLV